jgi:hypothetical protein
MVYKHLVVRYRQFLSLLIELLYLHVINEQELKMTKVVN